MNSQHSFHDRHNSLDLDGVDDTNPLSSLIPLELEAGPRDRVPPSKYYPFHETETQQILTVIDFKRSLTSFVDAAGQGGAELGIRGLPDSEGMRGMI